MRSVSFDRAAEYYDATRALPEAVMDPTVAALAELLSGKRTLEIGGGTERFTAPLQGAGVRIVPVDISRPMLARARTKPVRDAVLGDATRLPFRGGSFGAALSVHVLHLIGDWWGALRELARVVRGEFVSALDNWDGFSMHRLYSEALEKRGVRDHTPGVRERDLERILPPKEKREVASYTNTYPAEYVLDRLENRTFSSQWDVPEDLHREILADLRLEYAGKQFERTIRVTVAAWDMGALATAVLGGP